MSEKLEKLMKLKEEYVRQCKEQGEEIVKDVLKDFFENCPEAAGIKWAQYTPHFNDGDPCTFSVGSVSIKFKESTSVDFLRENLSDWLTKDKVYKDRPATSEELLRSSWQKTYRELVEETEKSNEEIRGLLKEGGNHEDGYIDSYSILSNSSLSKSVEDLSSAIDKLEDVLELVFGDHVEVFVTPEKVRVEEYDHD